MSKKNPKKRKSKREKQEHANLDPKYNLKTRTDLIDHDYLHKLSKKELDWLNEFNKEYVSGSFDRERPKRNLHKKRKHIKDADDRNNARNRDILTRAKASNQLTDYETLIEEADENFNEDKIIEAIDSKNLNEAIVWLANQNNKEEIKLEKTLIQESKDTEES